LKNLLFVTSMAATFVLAGSAAQAAQITLFNTGVDAGGVSQSNGAAELHYSFVSTPDGPNTARVETDSNGYPAGYWLSDNSSSAWIGPVGNPDLSGSPGIYDYKTTFSLAGLDPFTASITGGWATDDDGIDILINGQTTHQVSGSFSTFSSFSITSGFTSGLNTIDFIVHNTSGPTGLRVQMTGTADALGGVPEPATWAMMLLGFGGLGVALRMSRRTRGAAVAA
jgi:hypothetical protein